MGLFDSMTAGQPAAMLGNSPSPQSSSTPAAESSLPPMPPQLLQAIAQMKNAQPQQKQAFIQKVSETIMSMPKDAETKQEIMQEFMKAMGIGAPASAPAGQPPVPPMMQSVRPMLGGAQ